MNLELLPAADKLIGSAPHIVATVLADADFDELKTWFSNLPWNATRCAHILDVLDAARGAKLLRQLPPEQISELLALMRPGLTTRLLLAMSKDERGAWLGSQAASTTREFNRLLGMDEDSAARLAVPQTVRLMRSDTVATAKQRLAKDSNVPASIMFMVDDAGRLQGQVHWRELALATDDKLLGELATPAPEMVGELADRDVVLKLMDRTAISVVPVVDAEHTFVGIITRGALLRAVEEETTADLQTMVGAGRDERALSSPLFAVRKRHGWLQINLLTAFLAASVVGLFEDTIATYTALAVLLPVVAGQSGNAGSQALAVTMRGLVLREVGLSSWMFIVMKEAQAGLMNGIGIAITTSAAVYVWSGGFGLPLVIGSAMVFAMVIAGIAGALVPIALMRLGQDPATSSSIVLTTVTDVAGFFAFLGIATALSPLL